METKSLISLILLLQAIINGVNLAAAQKPSPTQQIFKCSNNGNFNSDKLLKERDDAFNLLYKSYGNQGREYTGINIGNGDGIWTKALCPPINKMEDCRDCVMNTIPYLKKNCPKQKEGVAWTALTKMYCMVHYSVSPDPSILDWFLFSAPPGHPPTTANAGELEKGVNNLASKLKGMATDINNMKRYGFWSMNYASYPNILFGSMQCRTRVSDLECKKCLSEATNEMHKCCTKIRKQTGMILSVNCQFMYAHYNFLLL